MQSKTIKSLFIKARRREWITINVAAELIFNMAKWRPRKIVHDLEKPQVVASRAINLENAEKPFERRPKVDYREGFEETVNWYLARVTIQACAVTDESREKQYY